jgi:hypothetical protein
MKRGVLISLLIICTSFCSRAQDITIQIKDQFIQYSALLSQKKFDEAIRFLDPDFLEIVTKEQLIAALNKTLNSPDFDYKTGEPTVSDFKPTKLIGSKNYVKFISHMEIQMRFYKDEPRTADEKKLFISLLKATLEKQFGVGNLTYDDAIEYFKIKSNKNIIASSDDKMSEWKFVVVEPAQKALLSRFIPAELLD